MKYLKVDKKNYSILNDFEITLNTAAIVKGCLLEQDIKAHYEAQPAPQLHFNK